MTERDKKYLDYMELKYLEPGVQYYAQTDQDKSDERLKPRTGMSAAEYWFRGYDYREENETVDKTDERLFGKRTESSVTIEQESGDRKSYYEQFRNKKRNFGEQFDPY